MQKYALHFTILWFTKIYLSFGLVMDLGLFAFGMWVLVESVDILRSKFLGHVMVFVLFISWFFIWSDKWICKWLWFWNSGFAFEMWVQLKLLAAFYEVNSRVLLCLMIFVLLWCGFFILFWFERIWNWVWFWIRACLVGLGKGAFFA